MANHKIHGHPVLILGAGRGGTALLEMFIDDPLVKIVAMADLTLDAPGITLAQKHGIPVYAGARAALEACKNYPDCIVYNLTHDDAIAEDVARTLGNKNVTSGVAAKLVWQMVTNLKRVKGELEKNQSQLMAIINHAMDGIITINESGEIQGFNPAAEKIFGYSQQEMIGKSVKVLLAESEQRHDDRHLSWYVRSGTHGTVEVRGREVTAARRNGEQFPMELSASEMVLTGQSFFVGIVRDITDRKLAEQRIVHLAHHDYLTDLPNRALFLDRLERAVSLATRDKSTMAVLFLDLDGFKRINDTLGHDAGDLLLQEVARRLTGTIRDSDTLARVGGDEFTFVLNAIGVKDNASLVAAKIIDALAQPFELKGQACHVGGSIGIALFPDDAKDFETLLRRADEAMYLAKQRGKNGYRFYREVLSEGVGDSDSRD